MFSSRQVSYNTHISRFALTGRWEEHGLILSLRERQKVSDKLCQSGTFSVETSMPDGLDYDKGDMGLHANLRLFNRDIRLELRYKTESDSWFLTVYQGISGTMRETGTKFMRPELQKLVDSFLILGDTLFENRALSPKS